MVRPGNGEEKKKRGHRYHEEGGVGGLEKARAGRAHTKAQSGAGVGEAMIRRTARGLYLLS